MAKEIVHCIEIKPGAYLVSKEFLAEIERQTQKTTWVGSIFGVEVRESKHLPMTVEVKDELPTNNSH